MPPSGKVSLRSILNAIIHMCHTTYILQNTHTRNRNKATHTTTVRCFWVPESDEQRLTAVFEVNEQFAKVPDASDPEIKIAPPYNGTTTKPDTHMPPSGQPSFRSILNAIIHMRHTTYRLQNTHTRNRNKATHTHTHTVRSIFSQIDLQRNHSHAPHDLQTANYTRNRDNATHTHTPPRSDNCKCLQHLNDNLRQCLKWMNSLQRFLMPLIQRSK